MPDEAIHEARVLIDLVGRSTLEGTEGDMRLAPAREEWGYLQDKAVRDHAVTAIGAFANTMHDTVLEIVRDQWACHGEPVQTIQYLGKYPCDSWVRRWEFGGNQGGVLPHFDTEPSDVENGSLPVTVLAVLLGNGERFFINPGDAEQVRSDDAPSLQLKTNDVLVFPSSFVHWGDACFRTRITCAMHFLINFGRPRNTNQDPTAQGDTSAGTVSRDRPTKPRASRK
jgi:hypothetical protein